MQFRLQHVLLMAVLAIVLSFGGQVQYGFAQTSENDAGRLSRDVITGDTGDFLSALKKLTQRANPDVVATLTLAIRFRGAHEALLDTVSSITGETITDWEDAMLWQERNPEVVPHSSYRELKLQLYTRIDPNFLRFLGGERSKRENMDIRLEEIAWGGVVVDGIPSLDNPELIEAEKAEFLLDDDLVFGVEINGDVRAYPLRIMGWHEMFNETIGGVPVALAYCTLCGAGILFETKLPDRDKPLVFGSSGFLYRSNKLMFDRQTDSLWNQFTGEPVSGPLRGSGIKLKIRPVTITTWAAWKRKNPQTRVLSLNTGHRRDYGPGVVYRSYFASPDLMFPAVVGDESVVKRKDYVFGIRDVGAAKAWPLSVFGEGRVINDSIGSRNLVLVGDHKSRTVRAYERGDMEFAITDNDEVLAGPGGEWTVTEAALVGGDGTKLARLPGHVAYWFAWDGYMGINSELFQD